MYIMNLLTISTKNTLLYACISMLCILILARDIMGIVVPNISFAIMVAVVALILKLNKFKIFLFFLFPFTCGVPGYTMLVSIIALFIKSIVNKVQIRSLQILPTLFIALLELFNNLIHLGDIDINSYASFISFTAVFFFILFDKSNYKQSRECLIAFIFGTLFVAIVIYYKIITEYGFDMLLSGSLRGAMGSVNEEGVSELITNANNMAYLSIILVSSLLMGAKTLRISPLLCNFLLVLSILIGMGSFSRAWLLLFALTTVTYLLYKRNIKVLFSLVLISIVIMLTFSNIIDAFIDVMINRLEGENIETAGGRIVIFSKYNEAWTQNLLYILFGASAISCREVLNFSGDMHNAIQQIYVSTGLVGLFLYISLFIRFFRERFIGKRTFLNYLPFLAGAVFVQSIQFLHPYFLMLPMIPAFYAYFVRAEY